MDQLSYVVDGSLGAIPLNKMHLMHAQVLKRKPLGSSNPIASDRPVLVGTQQLQSNVLYESSNNPNVRYYVPLYRTSLSNSKPEVELRYSGGEEDGEVGRLTLTLTWDPPTAPPGMQLRVIDHMTDLELRFLIPVQGKVNTAGKDTIALQPLQWEAENKATPSVDGSGELHELERQLDGERQRERQLESALEQERELDAEFAREREPQWDPGNPRPRQRPPMRPRGRMQVLERELAQARAHVRELESALAQARARELDRGQQEAPRKAKSITIFPRKDQFDAVYQAMSDVSRQAVLHIKITARVGVKTWQQVAVGGMAGSEQQANALARRGALFTRTLNTETLATLDKSAISMNRSRVQMKSLQPDEQIRVNVVKGTMERPELAMRSVKTAPRFAAVQPLAASSVAPTERVVSPTAMRTVAPAMREARMMPFMAPDSTGVTTKKMLVQQNDLKGAAPVEPAVSVAPVLSSATLFMVNAPQLATALTISDLRINDSTALPIQIALDMRGTPAIIDTELESQQECNFCFDPSLPGNPNREVFMTEGFDPGGIHLLLPLALTASSGQMFIVFQDNLMREVVHVAPSEFRLARDRQPPFLPGLSLLPADFTTSDHGNNVDVLFQMVMNYQLEAWLDPEMIQLARVEMARQGVVAPRITPILPREATLTLALEEGLAQLRSRDKATVDPATGITDTLVVDNDAFTNIWRNHLAQPGVGISGQVRYQLFDGSEAHSDVSISFWETSPDVFDTTFIGAVDGKVGQFRVRVTNRIESPVTIVQLPSVVLHEGIVAHVVDAGAFINKQLESRKWVDIDYLVPPPHDAKVVDVKPTVFGRVEPDLKALLRVLMLSPGYSSMGFTVPVKAKDGVFATSQGPEPLTGLLVEFDDGTKTRLTPEDPATEVFLVGRLADHLLGKVDDQHRYFFRVTNLHPSGEGARSGWWERQGSDLLDVPATVVQLDF
jgi:hypothetical protein